VTAPVVPAPNSLTEFFWEGAKRHELVIQRCNSCRQFQHWPEPICHHCLSFDLAGDRVSGRGTVYSYEIATQAFHPYFEARLPFVIAVIELADQPHLKMVSNLVDFAADGLAVGASVEVAFQRLNDDFTLPVFRPASS
jgi:uncharacterized OB-fold protein